MKLIVFHFQKLSLVEKGPKPLQFHPIFLPITEVITTITPMVGIRMSIEVENSELPD